MTFSSTNLEEADLTEASLSYTIFCQTDLSTTVGLNTCEFEGPSSIDAQTLEASGDLPLSFLRGCGLSDLFIRHIPSLFHDNPIQFYSCFISYSHKDKTFAKRLFDTLQGKGVRCWLDEKQLLPGDDIYEGVDRGVRLWDKVLLCCSEHSLTSWWVDKEAVKILGASPEAFDIDFMN